SAAGVGRSAATAARRAETAAAPAIRTRSAITGRAVIPLRSRGLPGSAVAGGVVPATRRTEILIALPLPYDWRRERSLPAATRSVALPLAEVLATALTLGSARRPVASVARWGPTGSRFAEVIPSAVRSTRPGVLHRRSLTAANRRT